MGNSLRIDDVISYVCMRQGHHIYGLLPSQHHAIAWIHADFLSNTVKPVCNDHLYNKMYYLWFIQ